MKILQQIPNMLESPVRPSVLKCQSKNLVGRDNQQASKMNSHFQKFGANITRKLDRLGCVCVQAPEITKGHPNTVGKGGGMIRPLMKIREDMRNYVPPQGKTLGSVIPRGMKATECIDGR